MFDPMCTLTPSDAKAAEARAGMYSLLAHAWRYPDELLVRRLHQEGVPRLECERLSSQATRDAEAGLRKAVDRMRREPDLALRELVGSHLRLFGHAVRGTCPPYELEYGRGEIIQQTADLADLAGFYAAFGLCLGEGAYERADHVCVECEFMCVLCAKEAWGIRQGNMELVDACCDAQRQFLRDHLARWLPAFSHRVASLDPDGFHGHAAALAAAFIDEECRAFDIEAGPQWLELRPVDASRDAEIDCDSGGCGESAGEQLVQLGLDRPTGHAK